MDSSKDKDIVKKKDDNVSTEQPNDLDTRPVEFRTWDGKLSTEAHDKAYMELALRAGNHSDLVKRILRQRIEARAKDFPRWPAEMSAGVRTVWIESRFWYDRERLSADFDEDWRSYRAQYLHSLELDPREPVHVPEYELELINPIRRFTMIPGDWLENKILKKIAPDEKHSAVWRLSITRGLMIWAASIGVYYWYKYNMMNWTERAKPRVSITRPLIYPSHPQFPFKDYRTEPAHHADYGFARRTIFKDLRDWEDTTIVL